MQGLWQRVSLSFQQLPTEERLIVLSVVLACLVAVAFYVIRRVRGGVYAPASLVTDHLSEFRRMRESGQLDEQEYSRVVQSISAVEQNDEGPTTAPVGDPLSGRTADEMSSP